VCSSDLGLVHDQSASGATYYIEPFAVVELNNELRELKLDEKKEIARILKEITEMVGEHVDAIRLNQINLVQIDFIFAKAKLSLKMKAFEPRLNDQGYIYIKKGRHPLLDQSEVVPTEIWIGKDFKTLLITGPNTGGKTVTIKTVGLLTLMTQCGLHIPTNDGSEISVFEKVFADIGDEQSIEQSLSTFSSHMTNIVHIMNNVDKKSLVLFDELGAGTDPTEGAALAKSILSKLFKWEVITIATTHYSELKEFALVKDGIENACVEFNIETLSPTYKLLIGVPGKSNAFEISRKLGLSDEIIDSAKEFIHSDDIEFEDLLSSIEENRKISEVERDEAVRMRLEVEKLKAKLKDKEDKIAQRREKLLNEARKEAQAMLAGAQDEADNLMKEIRGIGKVVTKEKNKRLEEIRRDLKDKKEGLNIPAPVEKISYGVDPKVIRLGQAVRVSGFDQTGVVATLPNGKGDLQIQLGIMKVKANTKNLKLMDEEVLEKKSKIIQREVNDRSANVSSEIDLRGVNVDDAVIALDKYFDEAIMGNLKMVRVIHGKGTGALKAGLKPFFRNHPHVKSFKDGEYNEGGSGVSIIELK
jgi:DNA mismatch repair protein MutS2